MTTPQILYLLTPLFLAFASIFFLQHRNKLTGCRCMSRLLRVLASIDQPTEGTSRYSVGTEANSDCGTNERLSVTGSNQSSHYASHNR